MLEPGELQYFFPDSIERTVAPPGLHLCIPAERDKRGVQYPDTAVLHFVQQPPAYVAIGGRYSRSERRKEQMAPP